MDYKFAVSFSTDESVKASLMAARVSEILEDSDFSVFVESDKKKARNVSVTPLKK